MKRTVLAMAFLFVASLLSLESVALPAAITADHQSANDFANIPNQFFNQARSTFHIYYGHTSHGSQVITGLSMLENQDATLYEPPSIFDNDGIDLGDSTWESETRDYLADHPQTNLVMWSWCEQLSGDTPPDQVNDYLNRMNTLEGDYPGVTFVYMTGHLDGTGPTGTLYTNNNRIRNYCKNTNKVLFDFADIESYNPDGTYYPDGSDWCEWCTTWCASHSCPGCGDCAHSQCFNCYRKGQGFWWLLARLAGWSPSASILYVDPEGVCNGFTPCYGTLQAAVSAAGDGAQIWIGAGDYDETVVLNEIKTLILRGGWNDAYTTQTANLTIIRSPVVTLGSLTFQIVHIVP